MTAATPAAAAIYVDAGLPDVAADKKVTVANPQAVQLIFQFLTKGAPNAAATKQVKADVIAAVTESGLFSEISEGPVANGAILNVVIDNALSQGEQSDAAAKGVLPGRPWGSPARQSASPIRARSTMFRVHRLR